MPEFPRSPRLLKGALIVYDSQTPGPAPRVIAFQYNPEQVNRSLAARSNPRPAGNVGGAKEDVLRVLGPPVETINLSVVLNAADQLADPAKHPKVLESGLHPVLATLELLLYTPTSRVQQIAAQAGRGEVQVTPADLPVALFVWGKARVVPVLLTNFSVAEEAFDPDLNPIQAKVDLGLRVLTYMELKRNTLGFRAYLAYQLQKESLAQQYQAPGAVERIRGLTSF